MDSIKRIGMNCKFAGIWLLATAGILVYGETAPSVQDPDFTATFFFLGLGLLVFYFGCFCCLKSDRKEKTR